MGLEFYCLKFKSKLTFGTLGVIGNQGYVGKSSKKCLSGLQNIFAISFSSCCSHGVSRLFLIGYGSNRFTLHLEAIILIFLVGV